MVALPFSCVPDCDIGISSFSSLRMTSKLLLNLHRCVDCDWTAQMSCSLRLLPARGRSVVSLCSGGGGNIGCGRASFCFCLACSDSNMLSSSW